MTTFVPQKSVFRAAGLIGLFVLGMLTLIGSTGQENNNPYCICDCNVAFCHQFNDYGAGNDALAENVLNVECIQGPRGATLGNSMDGKYIITGRYRLDEAGTVISIDWKGITTYESREDFTVIRAGEGDFVVKARKIDGGVGPLFLRVTDGNGALLFITRLQDGDCPT